MATSPTQQTVAHTDASLGARDCLLINGELVSAQSGNTYPNINPATEAILGQVADAGPEDMEAAIAAARHAFDDSDWSTNHALRHRCLQQQTLARFSLVV